MRELKEVILNTIEVPYQEYFVNMAVLQNDEGEHIS
jgi:hypothetical protein